MVIAYTLLENPSVEGDAATPMPQPTLAEANDNIQLAVAEGLAIQFKYHGGVNDTDMILCNFL